MSPVRSISEQSSPCQAVARTLSPVSRTMIESHELTVWWEKMLLGLAEDLTWAVLKGVGSSP